MSYYRRSFVSGATYFFTIVTGNRAPIFNNEQNVSLLRGALRTVMDVSPFEIIATVILHDHMHFLWSLPEGDKDYSSRIGRLKIAFTRSFRERFPIHIPLSDSQDSKRESGLWQRRFWEHTIRDDNDFKAHLDYTHYNPCKHGYCKSPVDWPWSSFDKWVRLGEYDANWGLTEGEVKSLRMMRIAEKAGE
jgi:putative transposase